MATDHYNFTGVFAHNCGVPPSVDGAGGGDPLIYTLGGLLFPVANVESADINFEDEHIRNVIDNVQSVYIDNRSQYTLTLRVATGPNYRIDAKSYTQGWYALPCRAGNRIAFRASGVISDPTLINVAFANVLIYGQQYATQ